MASNHETRVYDSILGLLPGEANPTPLVRLNRVVPFQHAVVYAKLEWYNPFGAVKDRVAANLVRDAEERGALTPGKKLVEATSGNTGLGLAMIGNAKGYPLRTPLSAAIPLEKRTVLRFFGSEVQELDDSLCPAPGAPEGAIARARDTAASQPGFVMLDQYTNAANPEAHFRTTGPEVWRQTEGKITHFVAGLGTCGTITGSGRFLKSKNPAIKVLGVYPEDGHDIPGVRSKRQLNQTKLYFPKEYDGEIEITNREALALCLRLNREDSIIAGPSSGMALAGAFRLIPDEPGVVAVVIFPDNIFKYASTICRHFPELCPPPPGVAGAPGATSSMIAAPSRSERFLDEMIENLKNPYDSVAVADLAQELAGKTPATPKPLVIDVRPLEQWTDLHIPGAINLPQSELSQRTGDLPPDRNAPIVMVCGIGKFSKHTTLFLKSLGYRNVRSLKGGINEWVRKQQPTASAGAAKNG
ncbi:MAG: pyridoxal-phosphate dependent enzyme [Opitutaceae bacterium]|nr:pyridoxal-phosphate dependent enzyme [Opitutaceae bacterium]